MKKILKINENGIIKEKEINYIPIRFIIAILLIIIETALVILLTVLCAIYIPYFYIALYLTEIFCVLAIINSNDNPDYKIPWLILVLIVPIVGFMVYFMFYNRKLSKKYIKKLENIEVKRLKKDDSKLLTKIAKSNKPVSLNVGLLCKLSKTHIYPNTDALYFKFGQEMYSSMLNDLKRAKKFIFLEYFIIESGLFWDSILNILKEKVASGIEVRVIYDDIGCMMTLPGDYYKTLESFGIKCVPFSKLRGQANNEFNNRSHRKIMVIDGVIGYTGGVNIADEYINKIEKHGIWKDGGVRLEGEAVKELTYLFLSDFEMNSHSLDLDFTPYLNTKTNIQNNGYVIPFGDGPEPIYNKRISKTMLMTMLNNATNYVYMTSPYLIIDNELRESIKNAALRGVDVRIILPHIPDKKLIFLMTRSYYKDLIASGVKIYEYTPGFIHAKTYISDDSVAIVGTMNLDYRSLVHHFENGVYFYNHNVLKSIKKDIENTIEESIYMNDKQIKNTILEKFLRAIIFSISPLL